jgi:serine/threonine-protein kinase
MSKAGVCDWIGLEIAEGRYQIQGTIGTGSMGQIYRAYDRHLDTAVVIKFPVAQELPAQNQSFLDRFSRETRSLVTLSHPHIVKVLDVGQFRGLPYVVMQYLAGGSLKDRMATGPSGELKPMPLFSLRSWLPQIAKAIDFVHSQHHIHRDVKPANILFDRHDNAFLGDFGIIKALTAETADASGNSLTAPGFLVGTPNYVAPEVVMGRPFDGRVDQYALAMTIHEVLTGTNCMEGPTPSATVVNQTMVVPPPLTDIVPDVSERISHAIRRGLAKNPDERFESCDALAEEVLAGIPPGTSVGSAPPRGGRTSRGEPGKVPCPCCGAPMPAGPEHAGSRLRCMGCQAICFVQILSRKTLQLKLVEFPPPATAAHSSIVIDGPDGEPGADPMAATVQVAAPSALSLLTGRPHLKSSLQRLTRKRLIFAVLGLLAVGAVIGLPLAAWLGRGSRSMSSGGEGARPGPDPDGRHGPETLAAPVLPSSPVEIHIVYGTEKQKWLEEATSDFAKTDVGGHIKVSLHGMGSVEGAQAILSGPSPFPIHVWSPASSAYRDLFEQEWRAAHSKSPILRSENLALTPMVFVMWQGRHNAFVKKYGKVTFQSISQALREPGGWETIAGESAWGRFKFSHTHPHRSNSGLLTLVLTAYEFARKERELSLADTTRTDYLEWLRKFEEGVVRPNGSLIHSTGTLMREMVLRGPSQYDCVLVYENLTIDYLEAARDRWGELRVDYPDPNIWNEHPYYILDVPWSDAGHRAAAGEFLAFLMSRPIQLQALAHGFRPGNPEVSIRSPDSPLIRHSVQGIKIDLPRMCEPPRAETVKKLLASTESSS